MALRTPLYDWHVAHGGRMVEFGGWDMPVQYGSIVEEHQTVRTAAGLFDISHMGRLSFVGAEALALIQQVYTNNAATMKEGQVRYGLICNERGGIRDDVLVYRWPERWANGRQRFQPRQDRGLAPAAQQRTRGGSDGSDGRDVHARRTRPASSRSVPRPHGSRRRAAGLLSRDTGPLSRQGMRRQPHRLHRRGWHRNHGAGGASRRAVGRSWFDAAPSRADSARAIRCVWKRPCRFMATN